MSELLGLTRLRAMATKASPAVLKKLPPGLLTKPRFTKPRLPARLGLLLSVRKKPDIERAAEPANGALLKIVDSAPVVEKSTRPAIPPTPALVE